MILEYQFAINLIAGIFLAVAQSIYLIQVLKKQITPSLFTWFGWSILVTVALVSQIIEYGWDWTLTGHLFAAFGCTFIFLSAFLTKNFVMRSQDCAGATGVAETAFRETGSGRSRAGEGSFAFRAVQARTLAFTL